MITLQDKLYESLLDDEEDLVNNGDYTVLFNEYNIDGKFEIIEKSGKIYINNKYGIPLRNNSDYITTSQSTREKMIKTSKFIFNNADLFNNEIEYCDVLNIQDGSFAEKIGCTSEINFNNVDKLVITSLKESKSSMHDKIVKNIHLKNINTILLAVYNGKYTKWIGELLKNTKINNISLMDSHTLDFLSEFKKIEADSVIIKGSLIFNSQDIKTYVPDLFTDLFDDFLKNNKIGKIIINAQKPKKVKKDNGIFMNKSSFEMIRIKNRYKLI